MVPWMSRAQDMLVAGDGSLWAGDEDLTEIHRSIRSMDDCHIKVGRRAFVPVLVHALDD